MIRKNKKRIDPRYFLNETAIREGDETEISKDANPQVEHAMAQLNAATACKNSDQVLSAVEAMSLLGVTGYFKDDEKAEDSVRQLLFGSDGLRAAAKEMDRRQRVGQGGGWWSLQQKSANLFSAFEKKGLIDASRTLKQIAQLATCSDAEWMQNDARYK